MQVYTLQLDVILQSLRDTELASLSCQISEGTTAIGTTGDVIVKRGQAVTCIILDANGDVVETGDSAYRYLNASERRWMLNIQDPERLIFHSHSHSPTPNFLPPQVISERELYHRLSILLNSQEKPLSVLKEEVIAIVKVLVQADFCSLDFSSEISIEKRTPDSLAIPLQIEHGIEKRYFGKLFCRWHLTPPASAELILSTIANSLSLYAASRFETPHTLSFFQALLAKRTSHDENLLAQANFHRVDVLQQHVVVLVQQQHTGTMSSVQQVFASLPMRTLLLLSEPYICALIHLSDARADSLLQAKLAEAARVLYPRHGILVAMGLPTTYSLLPFPENYRESALHAAAALLELSSLQHEHLFLSYRDDYRYYYRLQTQTPPIATTQFLLHLENLEKAERSSSRLIDILSLYLFSQSNSQKEMADQLQIPTSTYIRRFERIQQECKKYFHIDDPKVIPTMQAAMAIYRQRTQKAPEALLQTILHL